MKLKNNGNKEDVYKMAADTMVSSVEMYWESYRKPVKAFIVGRKIARWLNKIGMNTDQLANKLFKDEKIYPLATEELTVYLVPYSVWIELDSTEKFKIMESLKNFKPSKSKLDNQEVFEDNYFKRKKDAKKNEGQRS
ncbi:MAG: hypothetical protein GY699_09475 [Desulfobacteraceae bacterium]|nr:hypothetical protein [Desulfobacteraceae bacterium]